MGILEPNRVMSYSGSMWGIVGDNKSHVSSGAG